MSESRLALHKTSSASAALAAAICVAISQLIGLIFWSGSVGATLLYGISLGIIAFGFTYAALFFTGLATAPRRHPAMRG